MPTAIRSRRTSPTFEFANRFLGRTIADTPSVWVAMRDHRQAPGERTYWPQWGNYSYWLYQDDNVAGGRTVTETNDPNVALPVYNPALPAGKEGWSTRRTDQATGNPYMWLKVDDGYINGNSPAVAVQGDVLGSRQPIPGHCAMTRRAANGRPRRRAAATPGCRSRERHLEGRRLRDLRRRAGQSPGGRQRSAH